MITVQLILVILLLLLARTHSMSQDNRTAKKSITQGNSVQSCAISQQQKYKLQGEQFCIYINIMLGNFEIKFKVVFCYKLKSYFVLYLQYTSCQSSVPRIITTQVGGDGQMFSKKSVKAIILDSATECLRLFFIETSPKCLHLNDVMLSLFIISTMQCICCVSFSFPGLLSFFSWCGLGMRRKMCPVCKFICNSYWTEYNSGS